MDIYKNGDNMEEEIVYPEEYPAEFEEEIEYIEYILSKEYGEKIVINR